MAVEGVVVESVDGLEDEDAMAEEREIMICLWLFK